MEQPLSICLLYWSCTPVPEKECGQQKSLSDWIYRLLNCRNSETGLSLSLDHASGMTYHGIWERARAVSFKQTLKTQLFNRVYPSMLHHWHLIALPPSSETQQMSYRRQYCTCKNVGKKGVKINCEKMSVALKCESGEIQWMTFTVHMHIVSNEI